MPNVRHRHLDGRQDTLSSPSSKELICPARIDTNFALAYQFLDYSRPVRNQIVKALWRKNSRRRPFRLSTTNQAFSALSAQVRPTMLIVISSLLRCGAMWTQLRHALVAIGASRFFRRDMPN